MTAGCKGGWASCRADGCWLCLVEGNAAEAASLGVGLWSADGRELFILLAGLMSLHCVRPVAFSCLMLMMTLCKINLPTFIFILRNAQAMVAFKT